MASLRRSRKVTRRTQPQGSTKIDWSNPITKSICFATDYSGRDIISNTFPALVGSPVNKANLAGKSYYFGGGAANTKHLKYGNNTSTDVIFNSPGTLFFLVVPNTTTGSFTIAGKSGNDYLEGWALFQSGTGILFYDVDYNDSIINVPSGNLVAGKVNSICITYDPTVSEPKNKAYTNGVFLGGSSGWAAGGKLTDSAFPLRIGGAEFYPSGYTDYNGSILLSVFFRRKLNPAEIVSLSQNPWQIFNSTELIISTGASVGTITRPNSDIAVSGWTSSDGAPLYDDIDEVTASDVDYIISPELTSTASGATFGLTTSLVAGTYDVNIRARKTETTGQIRVVLKDSGGTSVGATNWQVLTGSYVSYVLRITITGTATQSTIEAKL